MKAIAAQPLTAAVLVTAVTISGTGLHPMDVTPPRLRAEIASVRLQAMTVAEPAQILTDVVKAAAAVAVAAVWWVGFPVTLPVSFVVGGLLSLYSSGITMGQQTPNPLLAGLGVYLSLPTYLVAYTFNQLGISLGLVDVPTQTPPPSAALSSRKQAAHTSKMKPARAAATTRSTRKAATHAGKSSKSSAAQGRHATPR